MATELVEVSAVTRAHVEDAARTPGNQPAVEAGPGPGPEFDQQTREATVILVVGVVIGGIEGGQLRFEGPRSEKLRAATATLLHREGAGWLDEILEIHHVGAIEPGAIRAADRAHDHPVLTRVRGLSCGLHC